MSSVRHTLGVGKALALALGLALAGCASGGADTDLAVQDPSTIHFEPNQRPSQKLDLGDFEFEFSDIEVSKSGEPSAYEVAQWVKHRYEASLRCLRATPPDYDQARSLLDEVVKNVPSASRVRALLARLNFSDAAYWYQVADRVSWEMTRVQYEKTAEPNGAPLSEEELKELVDSFQPYLDRAAKKMEKHARAALRNFEAYRKVRPDDRAVTDYVWKLYFYLRNYDKALQWLDYVLREMDLAEVPEEEPIRKDYTSIRRSIVSYLAELRLQGVDSRSQRDDGGLFPFGHEGSRSARDRLGEARTPGR